jgi:hypothetical protein
MRLLWYLTDVGKAIKTHRTKRAVIATFARFKNDY